MIFHFPHAFYSNKFMGNSISQLPVNWSGGIASNSPKLNKYNYLILGALHEVSIEYISIELMIAPIKQFKSHMFHIGLIDSFCT